MKIDRSIKETLKVDARGNCERAKILYIISNAPDSASAVELARLSAPEYFGIARKSSVSISNSHGGGIFEVAVEYTVSRISSSASPQKKAGDKVWTFSVNGRKKQLHEAYNTQSYRIETSGPDLSPGKLINWNGQNGAFAKSGSVDVIQPELTETCVATFKASKITASFMKKIADVVGKVNDSSFHHWASGEVLLSGITHGGEYENSSGKKLCDITFNFSIRPNETREVNGKQISIDGWDYFWILPAANDSSKIHMAYVSEVYQRADYGKLGL